MPFSAGVFTRLYNWVSDKNNGINLKADRLDAEFDGIASGMSMAILKDGTQSITADIPFNNKKITGLADPSAKNHALTLGYAGSGAVDWYGDAGGSANSIVLTSNGASAGSLVNGLLVRFRVTAQNTNAVTLTYPAQATKAFVKNGNLDFGEGELKVGDIVTATYSTALDKWVSTGALGQAFALSLTGSVIYTTLPTPPTGWLKANGAAISRTAYADLFAAIGTTYGAGNGASTFNLPDLRGEFIRGWDDGRGVDNGRVLGAYQTDELKSHAHTIPSGYGGGAYAGYVDIGGSGANFGTQAVTNTTGGSETRPRNIALLACIKF